MLLQLQLFAEGAYLLLCVIDSPIEDLGPSDVPIGNRHFHRFPRADFVGSAFVVNVRSVRIALDSPCGNLIVDVYIE